MKKKIFIAAAVIISSPALAQKAQIDLKDSTLKVLDEVVVTANKFPSKTSLTGKVLTIITRNELEKSGGKDLSQVLTEQAGLFVNGANSNPGKDKSVYLRGAKTDHTLITIDGIPVYDPSGIGSNFDIRLIPLCNIERIEILKGSQSTLYGSDAVAGVINIITRKAGKEQAGLEGGFGYGSYHTLQGNATWSGRQKKTGYRLGCNFSKTNGINEITDTVTRLHTTDKDGYEQKSIYASLDLHPSQKITSMPYLRYTGIRGDLDQGAFTDELDYTYTSGNFQAGIINEFQMGKAGLHLLYQYNSTNRVYTDDSVKSRNGFSDYSRGSYKGQEHFADLFLVTSLPYNLKLTAGTDYRESGSNQDYLSISSYGPYKSQLGKDSLKQRQLGVYAALLYHNRNGFNTELGGRMNRHSEYGGNFVYNFNPFFLFNQRWKLFANMSSGYKTPTLYQLYSEYGNTLLKPETAWSAEGGLQYYAKDNRSGARITFFRRHVKNVIAFFTDPVNYHSYYINQDQQEDHGLELEASMLLCRQALLKLFYTYVDGNIITRNSNNKDTTFFNLFRRPKSNFGLSIGGNITPAFYYSAGLTAVGERTDITYDAGYNQVQVKLKSYLHCNLYLEYNRGTRLKFYADLHNITGTKFTEVYGFNTMGFNASAGIRFSF